MNQIAEFFAKLLSSDDFPRRWDCGKWSDFHGWLYIVSDLLIWSAYFAIPLIILRYVSRKQEGHLSFNKLYFLFAGFIVACGMTHFFDVIMFWEPVYRVSALVRLLTGIISWVTVIYLIRFLPIAFSMRTQKELQAEVMRRMNAEEALQRQNRLLNESQRMTQVGSWEWHTGDDFLTLSEEAQRIYGVKEEEGTPLRYRNLLDAVHPDDRGFVEESFRKARHSHQFEAIQYRVIIADGGIRQLLTRGETEITTSTDGEKRVIRISGTVQDVSNTAGADEGLRLESRTLELQRTNAEMEQFAYVASHDLQEPLRKISTFSNMLESEMGSRGSEKEQLYLKKIGQSAGRMQQLIADILAFSHLAQPATGFVKTDLRHLIAGVLLDLEVAIRTSNAHISLGQFPEIVAVPGQLRQLFQNLLSNAIKFRRPDVKPELTIAGETLSGSDLDPQQQAYIGQYLAAAQRNTLAGLQFCHITIADNGIGFEAEYAQKIFNIFQRLHGRSEYEGTGIGLAVCRRISENHHGFLWAESVKGEGATFHVLLPVEQGAFGEGIGN